MKKILFVLLLAFVSLGIVKNTYAVSDKVFIIDSSNYNTAFDLCTSDCSDYNSFNVSVNYPSSWSHAGSSQLLFYFNFNYNGSPSSVNVYTPFAFIDSFNFNFSDFYMPLNSIRYYALQNSSGFIGAGGSIVLTLSESSSGGGSTPVPEPEPCPDPEENSQYMNVVLDSFWKYHAAFGGAVVAIIVIFFVYRLIKGVMR